MAKTRRAFTPEFKAEAVKLVTEQGEGLAEVARDLDLGESMLRARKRALAKAGDRAFSGKGNPPALEEERRRLRAENKRLTIPGRPIGPGRPTSLISRPARVGPTWRWWRTCIRGGSWAGRWARGSTAGWSSTLSKWPGPVASPARVWWPIRIAGAGMPASIIGGCWPGMGSPVA